MVEQGDVPVAAADTATKVGLLAKVEVDGPRQVLATQGLIGPSREDVVYERGGHPGAPSLAWKPRVWPLDVLFGDGEGPPSPSN